jgi:hypothetical protein
MPPPLLEIHFYMTMNDGGVLFWLRHPPNLTIPEVEGCDHDGDGEAYYNDDLSMIA